MAFHHGRLNQPLRGGDPDAGGRLGCGGRDLNGPERGVSRARRDVPVI
jgi:hypothetical protein